MFDKCLTKHSPIECLRFVPAVPGESPPSPWDSQDMQMSVCGNYNRKNVQKINVCKLNNNTAGVEIKPMYK